MSAGSPKAPFHAPHRCVSAAALFESTVSPTHPTPPFLLRTIAACFGLVSIDASPLHPPVGRCSRLCLPYTFCALNIHCKHMAVSVVVYMPLPGTICICFDILLLCTRNTGDYSLPCHINPSACSGEYCGIFSQANALPELLFRSFAAPPKHDVGFYESAPLFLSVFYERIYRPQSLLDPIMSFDSFFPAFRRQ